MILDYFLIPSNDGQMMVKYPDFALIVFRAVMEFFNYVDVYRLVLQRVKKVPSAIKKRVIDA